MNDKESRAFLRGEMSFTPQRMMRYIRSRARLASDEDIEDILQNALILVAKHFDPNHPDAKLSPYCLSACNKAIAQNLERYHKIVLRKRNEPAPERMEDSVMSRNEGSLDGEMVAVTNYSSAQTFTEGAPGVSSQWRTTSLDSLFSDEDGRSADDVFGFEYGLMSSSSQGQDPADKATLNDLISQIMAELPEQIHRTCFLLKYVEGYKREDLISCLKMDPKSIDTIDKRIVRTLKAFKDKLDRDEARI
ncbi:MAG: hypothetical protein P4L53_27765 [Candidatus Obscuribacterales bacterium]|nr:hypothetical protein [Candidatus Obscuribacterales bacterium]